MGKRVLFSNGGNNFLNITIKETENSSSQRKVIYFCCDHRKIIFPLVAVVSRENAFSMLSYENIIH